MSNADIYYPALFDLALAAVTAHHVAYEAEVAEWYAEGPGQSAEWVTEYDDEGNGRRVNIGGNGYTFPECIHGMSRWTDYDNICGGCEASLTVEQEAEEIARSRAHSIAERVAFLQSAPGDLPAEIRSQIANWAFEPARF